MPKRTTPVEEALGWINNLIENLDRLMRELENYSSKLYNSNFIYEYYSILDLIDLIKLSKPVFEGVSNLYKLITDGKFTSISIFNYINATNIAGIIELTELLVHTLTYIDTSIPKITTKKKYIKLTEEIPELDESTYRLRYQSKQLYEYLNTLYSELYYMSRSRRPLP